MSEQTQSLGLVLGRTKDERRARACALVNRVSHATDYRLSTIVQSTTYCSQTNTREGVVWCLCVPHDPASRRVSSTLAERVHCRFSVVNSNFLAWPEHHNYNTELTPVFCDFDRVTTTTQRTQNKSTCTHLTLSQLGVETTAPQPLPLTLTLTLILHLAPPPPAKPKH